MEEQTKTCSKCGAVKSLDQFSKHRGMKDGLQSQCRDCKNESNAKWQARNKDHISTYSREYISSNREKVAGYKRGYYLDRPHVAWGTGYRKRAKKFGFDPVVEPFTKEQLIERYGDHCAHCGGPFEEVDHYPIPVALGGAHSLDNCVPSCRSCNLAPIVSIKQARAKGRI